MVTSTVALAAAMPAAMRIVFVFFFIEKPPFCSYTGSLHVNYTYIINKSLIYFNQAFCKLNVNLSVGLCFDELLLHVIVDLSRGVGVHIALIKIFFVGVNELVVDNIL